MLLWGTVAFNLAYSILYGIYLYFALLIEPCKNDIRKCPNLQWVALSILIFQAIIYINYMVCCVLLFISMKRIHSTIKANYVHWNTDCCQMASHVAAFTAPIILLIGIIFAADPWVVLQVNNEKIITGKVLVYKRDIQATFYFMLEISQAIIGMILLYIVTNYSIKQKVTKKKQTNQENQSILGRAQIVQEQLKKLDSENGDGEISESDELF